MNIPVYAASRFEQKSSEAPSSVTVVTSREIRKYGWKTLADLLRTVRGFHVSYDRSYHWVGVRGFLPPGDSNTKILIMLDGHRLNDDVYNLLDRSYSDLGGPEHLQELIPQDGRSFRLKVTASF
jgi:iron complex outermembrane receptor protein